MFYFGLCAFAAALAPVYSEPVRFERQEQVSDVEVVSQMAPLPEGNAADVPAPGIGGGFPVYGIQYTPSIQYTPGIALTPGYGVSSYPGYGLGGGGRGYGYGRFNRPRVYLNQPQIILHASANFVSDNADQGISGYVLFKQYGYTNPVVVTINATGVPPGKHALHIHAYGDLTQGCNSTGAHFQPALIGNIEVKDDGLASLTFQSPFVRMTGPRGIIGRSIVLHEKPIDNNRFPDIYGAPLDDRPPTSQQVETEETMVGSIIACGVIAVTDKLI